MKFWMGLRFRRPKRPIEHVSEDPVCKRLYQSLREIRDDPRHAKRKVKDALAGTALWRELYRALDEIAKDPGAARLLAPRALGRARLAFLLAKSLRNIAENPKRASMLAAAALIQGARRGSE